MVSGALTILLGDPPERVDLPPTSVAIRRRRTARVVFDKRLRLGKLVHDHVLISPGN